MVKYYELFNLFATPIFNTILEDVTNYDKNNLTNIVFQRDDRSSCWFSENKYVLQDEKYHSIRSKILKHFEFYVRNILEVSEDIDFYMTNSWVVKHRKGDKAHQHNHPNSVLSGIFYLNVDKDSGDIIFHRNPQDHIFGNLDLPVENQNMYNSKYWKFTPENNSLFFFPSTLSHSVTESFSDIERCVLVFNFFIKGRFGNPLSKLDII